jgi:hypothetical protein
MDLRELRDPDSSECGEKMENGMGCLKELG